jgi:uncharacterized protein YegP (UPF0339 family)
MATHFEIESRSDGEFVFSLKVGSEVILTSQEYTTKAACVNGIESVRKNASDENRYRRTTTPEGTFRFALDAANGQVIGSSGYYETASGRDDAVEFLRKNARDAEVKDLT